VTSQILERNIKSYSGNLNQDKSGLQRLTSPLHWRYQRLCISFVWRKLVVLTQLTSTLPFTSSPQLLVKCAGFTKSVLMITSLGCGCLLLQVN